METAEEEDEFAEKGRTIAKALDDIIAHIISVSDEAPSSTELPVFPHMETIDNESDSVSFAEKLQNAAVEHTLTQSTPQRFGNMLQGIFVDTRAAKGSTDGHSQYLVYCSGT